MVIQWLYTFLHVCELHWPLTSVARAAYGQSAASKEREKKRNAKKKMLALEAMLQQLPTNYATPLIEPEELISCRYSTSQGAHLVQVQYVPRNSCRAGTVRPEELISCRYSTSRGPHLVQVQYVPRNSSGAGTVRPKEPISCRYSTSQGTHLM